MSLDRIIETGSYVGNGSAQSISIGWQPAMLMLFSTNTGGSPATKGMALKLADMAGAEFYQYTNQSAYKTTEGITLTADGFAVGDEAVINKSGKTIHWIAIRAHFSIDSGSYVGQYPSIKVVDMGRSPSYLIVVNKDGTICSFWRPDNTTGLTGLRMTSGIQHSGTGLTLISTGFEANGSPNPNENGSNYSWVAFQALDGSTRNFETSSYEGNDGGAKTVELGYQPRFVILLCSNGSDEDAAWKSDTMSGEDHMLGAEGANKCLWTTAAGEGVTLISTGFQVASRWNLSGKSYHYLVGVE